MTNPVDPDTDQDEFAALRQSSQQEAEPEVVVPGQELARSISSRISELDPRVVVGIGVAALGLVTIVGFMVLFSLARNRPTPTQGTMVVVVTSNPTPEPSLTGAVKATLTLIPNANGTAGPLATIGITETLTNLPAPRFATLSEIRGTVQIRIESGGAWKTVNETLSIVPGTTILTGESSSVKITLSEGSVVRLSSQTQFSLTEMSGTADSPVTILGLDFGKLWAIVGSLGQGKFEVQLPIGVAAVRGSFMSVEHNSTDKVEIVTCLEGRCTYSNANGKVELTDLQQTESINGGPPGSVHSMDASQLAAWSAQFIPEVLTLTPTPTPTATLKPTKTNAPTRTPATTGTAGPSKTPSATPTRTSTPTITRTPSPTTTGTITPVTPTKTVTITPTRTSTPITPVANTPTPTVTATRTPTPTQTPPTPTDTDTPPPTDTDTPPAPTATDTETPAPTPTDTETPAPTPTDTETPEPTPTETPEPTPTETPTP